MNNKNIHQMWNAENPQTEIKIDFSELKSRNSRKAKIAFNLLIIRRLVEIALFVFFAQFLIRFLLNYGNEIQYALSGFSLLIFVIIGIFGNIGEIILIKKLDFSEDILTFQAKLERIKAYSLKILRVMLLSFPLYFAYIVIGFKAALNFDVVSNFNQNWLLGNIIFSILLVPISIWLFRKINLKSQSKWVKNLINDNGGKQIEKAMSFLNEIDSFKKTEK